MRSVALERRRVLALGHCGKEKTCLPLSKKALLQQDGRVTFQRQSDGRHLRDNEGWSTVEGRGLDTNKGSQQKREAAEEASQQVSVAPTRSAELWGQSV